MSVNLILGQGLTIGQGITFGSGSGGGGGGYPPGIFLNAGTFNPGDTMTWLFNQKAPNTKYYLWVDSGAYSGSNFTPAIVDGVTSVTTDGSGNATFSLVLNNTQTGGTFNMYFAPTLYQGNSNGGVGFMNITVNASSGGSGPGASGGAISLNIASISGSTIPDTSGGHNDGTIVGTFTTGSDSHGSYVHLSSGGYIDFSGYNLTAPFTVRLITSLDSSQRYWVTLWGNENYGAGEGYFAYQQSSTRLRAGPVNDPVYINNVSGITNVAQWDFVVDGSYNVLIYQNGSQIGSTYSSNGPSGGNATNDLYIGSRHNNNGSGSTDTCNMTVYKVNVYTSALSGSTIASDFTTNQSAFSI